MTVKVKKQKVHSLTGRITPPLMAKAFKAVKRNRGAAGIDKVSVRLFEENLEANLHALMRELKSGEFTPYPLRRVYIPKNATEFRPLGIPAVRDRVAQEVLRQLLNPIFEPLFHDHSFGFIAGRNCHQAIMAVLAFHDAGYKVVVDADIKGFFDNLAHPIIMSAVAREVADGNILRLIEKFLQSGVMENGIFKPTSIGTPQGGVISPLLANIVLNHLDWELHEAGYRFVRYADDFVIVTQTEHQAQEALAMVQRILGQDLGLQLSAEKTRITTYHQGYAFLGFKLSTRSRVMRDKSLQKFKEKVRELTCRKHNFEPLVIARLNRVIRGTANYFGAVFATCKSLFTRLDKWIRMRLRCMKLKRKRHRDNAKLRLKWFHKLGLVNLMDFVRG